MPLFTSGYHELNFSLKAFPLNRLYNNILVLKLFLTPVNIKYTWHSLLQKLNNNEKLSLNTKSLPTADVQESTRPMELTYKISKNLRFFFANMRSKFLFACIVQKFKITFLTLGVRKTTWVKILFITSVL